MGKKLYLSYAYDPKYAVEDRLFVERLKQHLGGTQNYTLLHFEFPNASFDPEKDARALKKEVSQSGLLIFVMSDYAYGDEQCIAELNHAISQQTRIIALHWRIPNLWEPPLETQNIRKKVDETNYIFVNRSENNAVDFSTAFSLLDKAIIDEYSVHDAFISYSRQNIDIARALRDNLERTHRKDIWFDNDDIGPGVQSWRETILTGINNSNAVVLLVSNHWLGSDNCDDEIKHALQHRKLIVPVFLYEPPLTEDLAVTDSNQRFAVKTSVLVPPSVDQALLAFRKRGGWRRDQENLTVDDLAEAEQYFAERLKLLEALHPIYFDETLLESFPFKTQNGIDEHRIRFKEGKISAAINQLLPRLPTLLDEYTTDHTKLLVRSLRPNEPLLNLREWLKYRRLLQNYAARIESPLITDDQRAYVRRSMNRLVFLYVTRITLILAVVFLITSIFLSLQASVARADAERAIVQMQLAEERVTAEQTLNIEISNRLQTLAQTSTQASVPLGRRPRQPLLQNSELWVSSAADGTVQRVRLDGLPIDHAVQVGADPETPVSDGQNLWVLSHAENTLTRLDPGGESAPMVIPVGLGPDKPIVVGDYVWVASLTQPLLTQVNRFTGEYRIVPLDYDEKRVLKGGKYLWTWRDDQLRRIDAVNRDEKVFTEYGMISDVLSSNQVLWLIGNGGTTLFQIDFETGAVLRRYPFNGKLNQPLVTDEAVYVNDESIVYRLSLDSEDILWRFAVADTTQLYYTEGRLWVFVRPDTLHVLDSETGNLMRTQTIVGVESSDAPVSDGLFLWVTPLGQATAYMLSLQDGSIFRQFTLCSDLIAPVYDSANMWFTCQGEDKLIAMPAFTSYFGERSTIINTERYTPVAVGGKLWILQGTTGRLIVYDMRQRHDFGVIELGGPLISLVKDGNYLWTAIESTGEVIRIDTSAFVQDNRDAFISSVKLDRSLNRLEIADHTIWVLHNDPRPGAPVTVLDRDSLQILRQPALGFAVSGLTIKGDKAWAVSMTDDGGMVYTLDSNTGEVIDSFDIPDTDYSAWAPTVIDNDLWFSIVVPSIYDMVPVTFNLMGDAQGGANNLFFLRRYTPDTKQWGERFPLPVPTTGPVWDGRRLWYNLLTTSPILRPTETGSESGVIALDPQTGAVTETFYHCNRTSPQGIDGTNSTLYLVNNLVISGCLSNVDSLAVYSTETYSQLHVYEHIGLDPNPPATDGKKIWVTFRSSNNMAVLDAQTGALLAVIRLLRIPTGAVYAEGQIWVYNAGDDVLQRIVTQVE